MAFVAAGTLALLLGGVLLILLQPEDPGPAARAVAVETRGERVTAPRTEPPSADERPSPAGAPRGENRPSPARPLSGREASAKLTPTLVVLELVDRQGERWEETRGVMVGEDGVVLCRYHPLLGAYSGVARLPDRSSDRAQILGVSAYLVAEDLALVRVRPVRKTFHAAPLAELPVDELHERGDEVYLFSNYRALVGTLSETRYTAADGVLRARLQSDDALPPEAFLAVDPFGTVLGLCRVEVDGRLVEPSAKLPRSGYRFLIDSVAPLAGSLAAPALTTLADLSVAAYEGTFADHLRHGEESHRARRWSEAIRAFEKALERVPYDIPTEEDVARVHEMLAQDYERETRALLDADRVGEALEVVSAGVERFVRDGTLWVLRGTTGLAAGEPPLDSVRALLEAKSLGVPTPQWKEPLEEGYMRLAQAAQASGDLRSEEAILLEGLGHIPDSAVFSLALAKLYYRLEDFDDVPQLLAEVDRIDPRMRSATDELRRRVEDALKRRNSVIIPISGDDRSYRAEAVLDRALRFEFIIDTGASFTAIPSDLAVQLGYDLQAAETIRLSTASGVITAPRILLDSIDVNGYIVRDLRVVVLPTGIGPREGLLGLNFLRHFKYTVDASRNEFRLQRP